MPRQRTLNTRQLKFCRNYVLGDTAGNISQSHRKAGYVCPTIEGHGANGIRLLKSERIQKEIAKLREKQFEKDSLSFSEKRAYLARAVRASVDAVGASSDLAQEVVEEVDREGRVKRKVKVVDKLRALELDNKMSGDNFADRSPQANNPFLFIVSLSKTEGNANALGDLQHNASVSRLPSSNDAPMIDAEIVSNTSTARATDSP